jgi:dCTP diphosphatase
VTIADLQQRLRDFAAEREWEQFHSPKNLVMALSVEAAELTEIFQWLTPAQSAAVMSDPKTAGAVADELADVFAYLLSLADVLAVDLPGALAAKMVRNAAKYPVSRARGTAAKYTEISGAGGPGD